MGSIVLHAGVAEMPWDLMLETHLEIAFTTPDLGGRRVIDRASAAALS